MEAAAGVSGAGQGRVGGEREARGEREGQGGGAEGGDLEVAAALSGGGFEEGATSRVGRRARARLLLGANERPKISRNKPKTSPKIAQK